MTLGLVIVVSGVYSNRLNVDADGTDHVHSSESDTEACRNADKWDANEGAVYLAVSLSSTQSCYIMHTHAKVTAKQYTQAQQCEAQEEVLVLANEWLEWVRCCSCPDLLK